MSSVGQSFGSVPLTIRFPLLEALQDGSSRLGLAGWTINCEGGGTDVKGLIRCESAAVDDLSVSNTAKLASLAMPDVASSAYLSNVYVGDFVSSVGVSPGRGSIHVKGLNSSEGYTSDIVFEDYVKVYSRQCGDNYKSFQLDCTNSDSAELTIEHGSVTTKKSSVLFNDAVEINDSGNITIKSKYNADGAVLVNPQISIINAELSIKGGSPYDIGEKAFLRVIDDDGTEVAFTFSDFKKLKGLVP